MKDDHITDTELSLTELIPQSGGNLLFEDRLALVRLGRGRVATKLELLDLLIKLNAAIAINPRKFLILQHYRRLVGIALDNNGKATE